MRVAVAVELLLMFIDCRYGEESRCGFESNDACTVDYLYDEAENELVVCILEWFGSEPDIEATNGLYFEAMVNDSEF